MVELTLVFFLGALVAGLFGVLLLPAIWHRATRLTRARLERALPLDTNEILAERDRERAVFAVKSLALDHRVEAMQQEVLRAKAEVGSRLALEADFRARIAALEEALKTSERTLAQAQATRDESQIDLDRVGAELIEARESLASLSEVRAQLKARLQDVSEKLENERRAREAAEVHAASAREAEAEERARAHALRNELLARQHEARDAALPPVAEAR